MNILSILTEFTAISEQDQRSKQMNRKIKKLIDTKLSEIQRKSVHFDLYC